MKATEFITEDDWEDSENEYNETERQVQAITEKYGLSPKLVDFAWEVKEDCGSYIRQNPRGATFDAMYRGIKAHEQVLKKKVRLKDRRPLDSPNTLHHYLNLYLKDKFGAPFRDAMFCSGDITQSENYGRTYLVFPRGNFEFLWSPDVDDIYSQYEDKDHNMDDEDFVERLLDDNRYYTTNLKQAVESGHEIMIRCMSYYALDNHGLTVEERKGIEAIIHL